MPLNYRIGDATQPYGVGNKVLVHVCNDVGAWGKGFVYAISKRWKEPEKQYRQWSKGDIDIPFQLGNVGYVQVEADLWVANLIGQHGRSLPSSPSLRSRTGYAKGRIAGIPPIRYDAIRDGLENVAVFAPEKSASVHMPRIGAGLAGGKWETIEQIIKETLVALGLEVTVYDLPK